MPSAIIRSAPVNDSVPISLPKDTDRPAVAITPELRRAAARRLVSQTLPDRAAAADAFLANAPKHGLDLELLFGTVHPSHPEPVRQVCLGARGSGRTLMLYLSEPPPGGDPGGDEAAARERAACLRAVCQHARRRFGDQVRLAQCLTDPRDGWSRTALELAGFRSVGDLLYLRKPLTPRTRREGRETPIIWPHGIEVRPLSELVPTADRAAQDALLAPCLDATYTDTLDCPELCGLRETRDILASHRAAGRFNPASWFVVLESGAARGCVLLSECPEQRNVELVYLGLARSLRGRGLGTKLMELCVRRARESGMDALVCAVDRRNTPALTLYTRAGMRAFAERSAYVLTLH